MFLEINEEMITVRKVIIEKVKIKAKLLYTVFATKTAGAITSYYTLKK